MSKSVTGYDCSQKFAPGAFRVQCGGRNVMMAVCIKAIVEEVWMSIVVSLEEWGIRDFCRNSLATFTFSVMILIGWWPGWLLQVPEELGRVLNGSSFHAILLPDNHVAQSYHGKVPVWEEMPVDYNRSTGCNFPHMDNPPNVSNA